MITGSFKPLALFLCTALSLHCFNCHAAAPEFESIEAAISASKYDDARQAIELARSSAAPGDNEYLDLLEFTNGLAAGELSSVEALAAQVIKSPDHAHRRAVLCMYAGHLSESDPMRAFDCYTLCLVDYPGSGSEAEATFGAAKCIGLFDSTLTAGKRDENPQLFDRVISEGLIFAAGKKSDSGLTRALLSAAPGAVDHASWPNAVYLAGKLLEKESVSEAYEQYAHVVELYQNSGAYVGAAYGLTNTLARGHVPPAECLGEEWFHDALYSGAWTSIERKGEYRSGQVALEWLLSINAGQKLQDNARMLLGRAMIRLGESEEALEVFRYMARDRKDTNHANEAQAEVVRILVDSEQWDALKDEALYLAELDHPRGRAYGVLSYVNACVAQGDFEVAIQFLRQVVQQNPTDPYVRFYNQRIHELSALCESC